MSIPGECLRITIAEGVATITLDRPARRNAMLLAMWEALPAAVHACDVAPEVAIIVLRGAGGHFGAGNDIAEFRTICADRRSAEHFGCAMAEATAAVERAAKPAIAAIEGDCYGASVALALACDIRVASSGSAFAITPAKLGALYLRSDLHRLSEAIGASRARTMIYTACKLDAAAAASVGLVDHIVPAEAFESGLSEFLTPILCGSQFTIRATKALLRGIGHIVPPPEDSDSLAWFVDATQGADFAEGVGAFLEKRRPRFRLP